jgi:hypothetical protein
MKRSSAHLHRLLTFFLCALLALSATGCNFLPVEEEELAPPLMKPATIEYKTEPAKRGTLIQQLRLTAGFYPENQETLTFSQGGRLKEKHVRLGAFVEEVTCWLNWIHPIWNFRLPSRRWSWKKAN